MAEKDPEQPDSEESPESQDPDPSGSTEDPSPEDLVREVLQETDAPDSTTDPEQSSPDDPDETEEEGDHQEHEQEEQQESSPLGGSGSIKEMLQKEAERAREEDEIESEEELPEGYLTIDQLPEPEPRTVPSWFKNLSAATGVLLVIALLTWYLILPLGGSLLSWRIHAAFRDGNPKSAAGWVRWGRIAGRWLVKSPDQLVGDYLKHVLDLGQLDAFEREYRDLKLERPTPRIHQVYIEYLLRRGRWEAAREQADRLLQFPRADMKAIGNLYLGKAQMMLGDLGPSQTSLKKARLLLGPDPEVLRAQRDLALRMSDNRRALSFAEQLREWKNQSPGRAFRARDYLQLAKIYENSERYRSAEQMLQKGLQIRPGHRELMRELVRRYILQRRWEMARSLLTQSARGTGYRRLYPLDPFGWWTTAEWKLSRDRAGQAIPMLERARALDGRNPEVHRLMGELHMEQFNQPRIAVRYFERAHRHGLRRLRFLDQFARAYYLSEQYRNAARYYTRLYDQLEEPPPSLLYNIGSSYLGAGEFTRASTHFARAHEEGFRSQGLYVQWGLTFELQGNRGQAFSKLEQGLQWADRNHVSKRPMQAQLDRMFENTSPRPLSRWLAPLETHGDIAHWKRVRADTPAAVAASP